MNPVKRKKIAKRKFYFERMKQLNQSASETITFVEKVVQEENKTELKEEETIPLALTIIEEAKEELKEEVKESKKKKKN